MRRTLSFEIETVDVGGTVSVRVSLGETEIGTYAAHTAYDDTAHATAETALAKALRPLIDKAMDWEGMERT